MFFLTPPVDILQSLAKGALPYAEQFGDPTIFSHALNIIGIPSPRDFQVEFKYVYYTEDEDVNDSGTTFENISSNGDAAIPDDLQNFGGGSGDANVLDIYATTPRFVKLNFIPAGDLLSFVNNDGEFDAAQSEGNEKLIRDNLSGILDESSWSSMGINNLPFAFFHLQDNNIYSETYDIYLKYCSQVQKELNPTNDEDEVLSDIIAESNPASDNVIDFLQSAKQNTGGSGIGFLDPNNGSFVGKSYAFREASILGQMNGKFVGTIAKRTAMNPFSIFDSALYNDFKSLQKLQNDVLSNVSNEDASIESYNLSLPNLSQTNFAGQGLLEPLEIAGPEDKKWEIELLGYLIEKWEVIETANGVVYDKKDPVVFGSNDVSMGIDTKVKTNARYMYRPRTIGMMKVPVLDLEDDVKYFVNILISSRPGNAQFVISDPSGLNQEGDISKPAGDASGGAPDLVFNYNHESKIMSFHWGWPRDPQRSIKYFKVYRRSSIYEPFQLLSLYDFQESNKPFPFIDKIRPSLIKKKSLGQVSHTMYQDLEFTKNSTYIYAIVAGTAHGEWTNYSPQYIVSFDELRNKLNVELISPAGAPEPYPNWRLRQDIKTPSGKTNLTEDLLKCSNMDKMHIFLDPDANTLKSSDPGGQPILDEDHILIDPVGSDPQTLDKFKNGRYFCVINNLDLHKSEKIELKIVARS